MASVAGAGAGVKSPGMGVVRTAGIAGDLRSGIQAPPSGRMAVAAAEDQGEEGNLH